MTATASARHPTTAAAISEGRPTTGTDPAPTASGVASPSTHTPTRRIARPLGPQELLAHVGHGRAWPHQEQSVHVAAVPPFPAQPRPQGDADEEREHEGHRDEHAHVAPGDDQLAEEVGQRHHRQEVDARR